MTRSTHQIPDQKDFAPRAVWLRRAGSGPLFPTSSPVARAHIVGEYVYTAGEDSAPSDVAWTELLAFLSDRRADVLIAQSPWDVADEFSQYVERVAALDTAGVWVILSTDAQPCEATVTDRA